MSFRSEKDEDEAFNSLSAEQRKFYRESYRDNGGDVRAALDSVLGSTWFKDEAPRRHLYSASRVKEDAK